MSSHGQRFRRRALRRGYKVDEVDEFLDRVEATLAGEPVAEPVAAQDVHDVVFRVRFGGYDEWQVDLHLDRVERQLEELEQRPSFGRAAARIAPPDRVNPPMGVAPPPDRMGPDRMGPPERMMPERMAPPDRMPERMMPERMMPERLTPPPDRMGPPPERMAPPVRAERAVPPMPPAAGRATPPPPPPPMGSAPPPAQSVGSAPLPTRSPSFPQYDEPTYGGFDGFEPGRRARPEMTTDIRLPGTPGASNVPPGEVARIDQLRQAFQPRRFGSGYDPAQVDRLFEGVVAALSGRSTVPISDSELDPAQFSLVPGGYYEPEVEDALKQVRDIMRRW